MRVRRAHHQPHALALMVTRLWHSIAGEVTLSPFTLAMLSGPMSLWLNSLGLLILLVNNGGVL